MYLNSCADSASCLIINQQSGAINEKITSCARNPLEKIHIKLAIYYHESGKRSPSVTYLSDFWYGFAHKMNDCVEDS